MIALRKAHQADYAFAREVHRRTMRVYVEPLFGWNEIEQKERFRQGFSIEGAQVIVRDGRDVGWLQVLDRDDEIYLRQIFVLPEFQRQGIGTALLRLLTAQWASLDKPVKLGVLKNNPARSLYERFGFRIEKVEEHRLVLSLRPPA